MKRSKPELLLLVMLRCLVSSSSHAQPYPTDQFKQDEAQCQQAKTVQQCRDALLACQRANDATATTSSESKRQLGQAHVLSNWASCEDKLGQYAQAEGHHRTALSLRRKLTGNEHPDVAASLNSLALVLAQQGKSREAEGLLWQALGLRQKLLGVEHPDVATTLDDLAVVLADQWKYRKAEALHLRALKLRRKLFGENNHAVAISLNNLAYVQNSQGKHSEAEKQFRQALATLQKLLGDEDPDVASSLGNLASALESQSKYGEAEARYRQALALRRKVLGEEHPDVALSLNNLAYALEAQGKYGEAEGLYRQALTLRQKASDNVHALAVSLNNLASVLSRQGRDSEAEGLHRQALALREKLFGVEDPYVASSQNNLAMVLYRMGKHVEAEGLIRQALKVEQKVLGKDHPYAVSSQNNLADMLESQGKYEEAEVLYRQALAWRHKRLGDKHPDVAISQNNLAFTLASQGKYGEAEGLYLRALKLLQKRLGVEHPDLAGGLNNLAVLQIQRGTLNSAVSVLNQAAQIREHQLRATVSEPRMQALFDRIRDQEDLIYGLLLQPKLSGLGKLALSTALLRKGRVAEAGAAANQAVQGQLGRADVAARFEEWQGVRQAREALLYGGPGALKPAEYRQRLGVLKQQAESLEHLLVAELPELKRLQPPAMDQIVSQVAARLPQDAVLVEVVWTRPYQAQGTGPAKRWGEPHYIAMLMFPDRHIVPVDLGEATAMDPQVRELLSALSSPGADAVKAAQAVFARVMQPLLGQLAGRRNIYLSLDGTLSLIPFDALHDGTDYLLGRYRFHYLSSGRDLLRDLAQRSASAAVVLGNPDFGKADEKSTAAGSASLYQRLSGLSQLPGTQREVGAIAERLHVDAKTQKQAREDVVRAVHAPRILHIATHGLFLRDVELPASAGLDRGLRRASAFDSPRSNIISVPVAESLPGELGAMNRSALVLADAARGAGAQDTARDGLLTADEARSLDLYGTQLVVLSACETGQGALSAGQGIYGLRRAFLVAGAETLVTSLWRVSDEATGDLMTRYYEKLLDKQKPGDRLGAMVEAMQEMRKKPGREHPYYWAPFLVIGQDGPLH